MKEKEYLKVIDIASLITIVIATICSLLFYVNGAKLLIQVSVISYFVSFLMMTAFYGLKAVLYKKEQKENNNTNVTQKDYVLLIVKAVLSLCLMAFTLFILIKF